MTDIYKTDAYWAEIQAQEEADEEARCLAKMRLEQSFKPKRVWTEEEIKVLIQTNDTVLYRALLKLYACQTDTEKETSSTRNRNGAGFNSYDAKFLTSVSKFLKARGYLTSKQKEITRKKLVKYNKQLTQIANA